MQVIVINLSSAIERRRFQEKQLQKLSLNYTILNATSIDDIDNKTYTKLYRDWLRPLRRSEIACYFSHRRCWEQVISSNKPALILEDDALLSTNITKILEEVKNYKNKDLVDLEVTGRKKNVSKYREALFKKIFLYKLYLNSSGAGGYVLFPSGAKKLLEKEKRTGISLADAHIASCHTLNSYQVEPAAVVQFILCPYYEIDNPEYVKFYTSATNSEAKHQKQEWFFRLRRLVNEVKQGLFKMKLSLISERRLISLEKNDFK